MTNQSHPEQGDQGQHQLPFFDQISICFNQTADVIVNGISAVTSLLQQISTKSNMLFLKGHGVELVNNPEALNNLCESLFTEPSQVYLCSTAYESALQFNPDAYAIDTLSQQPSIASCEIAGLGTWIEATQLGLALDYSSIALLPEFVAITASPDQPEFEQQLDLALAAAAFDLEPYLLLTGAAQSILNTEYESSSLRKKLISAEIYGVKEVLTGDEAILKLQECLASQTSLLRLELLKAPSTTQHQQDIQITSTTRCVLAL